MAQTFGKYELIEQIGQGGMAEVYLAKQIGDLAGFEKQVALKTIFPHLTEREDLVMMFLDEARIAAQLNHPNIVQVYDLGQVDDTLYIAMEYVHGQDLRRICEVGIERDDFLPRDLAARIMADAAAGLHYAHTSVDSQGKPRNIVHRDVSPQNILVSMDGQVKVGDFGVAKAEDRLGHTRSGQRKGKLSYMSPEQLEGRKVDARSDVYTLGIVLYETTVRTRLFRGRSDFETMSLIASGKVTPPSDLRPDFPAELEAVIMKALQMRPEDRFQSAQDFHMALEDWLHDQERRVGPVELSAYMRRLFPTGVGVAAVDQAGQQQPATQPMVDVRSAQQPAPAGPANPGAAPARRGPPPGASGPPAGARPPASAAPPGGAPPAAQQPAPADDLQDDGGWDVDVDEIGDFGSRRTTVLTVLGILAAIVGVAVVVYASMNTSTDLETDQQKALDRAKKLAAAQADKIPEAPDLVEVSLATEPAGAHVVVDGVLADGVTPGKFSLVAGQPNEVIFYHAQYPPKRVVLSGEAGAQDKPATFEPYAAEPKTGTLVIHSDPGQGIVYVDGERLGAAPQTIEDLPAGYDHHVEVRKKGYWDFAGIFQVVAGERNAFQVSLSSKDSAGSRHYVHVTYDAIPKNTGVTVGGKLIGSTRLVANQTRNKYLQVSLQKPNYHDQLRYVLLHDIGTFTLRTFLRPIKRGKGHLTVRVEPKGSKIYIGSKSYDSNPVKNIEVFEGQHHVVFETPSGQRYETNVKVLPDTSNKYQLQPGKKEVRVKRLE